MVFLRHRSKNAATYLQSFCAHRSVNQVSEIFSDFWRTIGDSARNESRDHAQGPGLQFSFWVSRMGCEMGWSDDVSDESGVDRKAKNEL